MNTYLDRWAAREKGLATSRWRNFASVQKDRNIATLSDEGTGLVPGSVNEADMSAEFVISTVSQDRTGDVVVPEGCRETLANYAANPRVFWGHQQDPIPVGSARHKDGSLALTIEKDRILSRCYFHGLTQFSNDLFALVAAREIEAASIGFMPLVAEKIGPRLRHAPPDGTGFDGWPSEGYFITKFDLLEWSFVGVPMNQEAIRRRLEKGIGGKPLCIELQRELEPLAPPRKAWSNGATLVRTPAFHKAVAGLTTELRRR